MKTQTDGLPAVNDAIKAQTDGIQAIIDALKTPPCPVFWVGRNAVETTTATTWDEAGPPDPDSQKGITNAAFSSKRAVIK